MNFWLKDQSVKNKDKIAVTDGAHQMTFKELYDDAFHLAQQLQNLNQTRIGLHINNRIESLVLIHACWIANIEIAMINTRLTKNEIFAQMNSIQVSTIVTTTTLEMDQFDIYTLEDIQNLSPQNINSNVFQLENIASIMFTSGTTGPQKAVPQTFENHLASAIGCKESLGYNQQTIWLSVLPIYHISGLSVILRSVIEGFTVRILEKYNTDTMLQIIQNENITHVSLVPQTLKWLMDAGLQSPYQLEKILLGGAKLSANLIQQALNYKLPIYNSFGMTETCSQFLTATPDMLAQRYDTVGVPSDNVEVKIKQPNQNGHGELLIKGNNVMNGYLYPVNLTDTFEDGFFKTGDIAEIDEDGFVMIYDRRKDLIISGGENIYPYQIESIAKYYPNIEDAVCIGQSDDTWGQVPILYYIADTQINEIELKQYMLDHLAKYKVPKSFYQVEELPYTSTGKLQRNKMIQKEEKNDY
ncbi:o-succinylbenzoate--CoA ligase [Staphylococcus pasteuri]|uniref:o-succinylbenzoate--CoA ligase n=1 Tax=Staphylococcus pasteuri TaxID=45972 RepID=UPI003F54479B